MGAKGRTRRVITVGAVIMGLLSAVGYGMAEEEVGTRAVPGMPGQPGGQLPVFPQRFDVKGPEVDSFGLTVTQPGPVVVDVQDQGAPLIVSLQSPGGQPITQQGTGNIRLIYNVTPQDVQRSMVWIVQLRLAQPAPPQMGGRAAGVVNVQSPPVDQAAAKRAVDAMRRVPTQQEMDQAGAENEAQLNQVIAAKKAQFHQDRERRRQAERDQIQPVLERLRGGMAGQVQSRGVDAAQDSQPEQTAPAEGDVGSRAVLGMVAPVRPPILKVIPQPAPATGSSAQAVGGTGSGPAQVAGPPHIVSLSANGGEPKKVIVITGTGFSPTPGQVFFTVPPDRALPSTIVNWTDTSVVVELPDVTGVMPYQANIFLQRGQDLSNRVPFDLTPRMEIRHFRGVVSDRRFSDTILTRPVGVLGGTIQHIRLPIPMSEVFGDKGNDEFFLRTQLKNGWVMTGADVVVSTIAKAFGGAYLQDQGSGPNPYINVRWWLNPISPYSIYGYVLHFTGPEGVPDGVVVP